jgi:aldose 1-epimerase
MSLEISRASEDGLDVTRITNTENGTSVGILPGSGALWHSWAVKRGSETVELIDHYTDGADLQKGLSQSYKSAKLSPFACRIPDGKYTFQGKHYEFARKFSDGNAIHGLLFDRPFSQGEPVSRGDAASVEFLYSYRKDDPGYPFDYDCTVTYTLNANNRVTIDTLIKNTGSGAIPIVDGWHPYFTTGSQVDGCRLRFASDRMVEFNDRLIPTGKFLPYDRFSRERPLGDIMLDNAFMLDHKAPQPLCSYYDPDKDIRLNIYPSENYLVLQLYIPPSRRSIAIETLSGAPDAFNNGIGLILLDPGTSRQFSVTYEVA